MFRLILTLHNHEEGYQRRLTLKSRYKDFTAAEQDAQKMIYTRLNDSGVVTHRCTAKIEKVAKAWAQK